MNWTLTITVGVTGSVTVLGLGYYLGVRYYLRRQRMKHEAVARPVEAEPVEAEQPEPTVEPDEASAGQARTRIGEARMRPPVDATAGEDDTGQ